MFHWIAAAFADQTSPVLSSAFLDGDLAFTDRAICGEAHHPQHTVVRLATQYQYVTQGQHGLKHGRRANDAVIEQGVERVAEPGQHRTDDAGENGPLEQDARRFIGRSW